MIGVQALPLAVLDIAYNGLIGVHGDVLVFDRDLLLPAVAVAVEDSGPGIAPSQLDDIFGAFVTTKPHGMGLGLAICRMIIEHHGGALTASSDGQNGATFQFVLPIKSDDNAG